MENITLLMSKLAWLAMSRQEPLIFLENPANVATSGGAPKLIATIGNAAWKFDSFTLHDLTEVYANLFCQLNGQDYYQSGYEAGFQTGTRANAATGT